MAKAPKEGSKKEEKSESRKEMMKEMKSGEEKMPAFLKKKK